MGTEEGRPPRPGAPRRRTGCPGLGSASSKLAGLGGRRRARRRPRPKVEASAELDALGLVGWLDWLGLLGLLVWLGWLGWETGRLGWLSWPRQVWDRKMQYPSAKMQKLH